jgi:hypothetical protein
MEVEQLAIPKRKAEEEYESLKSMFKLAHSYRTQDEVYKDLQRVYGHMKHGKKIIDIFDAFKQSGTMEGNPKLAIVRADAKLCYFEKEPDGGGTFSIKLFNNSWRNNHIKTDLDIKLPPTTYPWEVADPTKPLGEYLGWQGINIKNRCLQTVVPIIPSEILITEVKYNLNNYYLLWEVEKWKPVPPKDPILLKRLTPNLFGVLATWNLTALERAVIRGRIA